MAAVAETATAQRERPGEALYAKLKPGPGRPAPAVADHQRARIHSAMVEAVAGRGYRAVAVRELASLAQVSTRTFYKHYTGKEDCFLRTHELVVRRIVRGMLAVQAGERDWRKRLRLAIEAFLRGIARDPGAAQLILVDAYAAGPAAREQVRRAEHTLEARFANCFARDPEERPMPPLLLKGIVSGITSTARSRVLAGSEGVLPALAGELTEWALALHEAPLEKPADWASLPQAARPVRRCASPATSDRDLLLCAATKLIAAGGYESLTRSRICKAAGVSQPSFAANFDSVEECVVAAFESRAAEMLREAERVTAEADAWPDSVHAAIELLFTEIATDPLFAPLCLSEIRVAGPNGLRSQVNLLTELAGRIHAGLPSEGRVSTLVCEASIGAACGLLEQASTEDRPRSASQVAAALSTYAQVSSGCGVGRVDGRVA